MQLYSKCVKMCEIGFRWHDLGIKKERQNAAGGEDVADFERKMCDILSLREQRKTPEKPNGFGGFLAHPARFERATFRLGGGRSILLSYGCVFSFVSTIDLSLRSPSNHVHLFTRIQKFHSKKRHNH